MSESTVTPTAAGSPAATPVSKPVGEVIQISDQCLVQKHLGEVVRSTVQCTLSALRDVEG